MTKKELRNIYKQKRISIQPKEKSMLDDLMLIQFQHMSLQNIHILLSYFPLEIKGEPDTHLFSRYLKHMLPSLQISYPVTDFLKDTMHSVLTNEDTVFKENEYGLTEPQSGEVISPEIIDITFVPFLICDNEGYRVGYGKGFYDKYLPLCRTDVLKIGFSYFEPVDKIDDAQPFDVPLNYCITPESIYEF